MTMAGEQVKQSQLHRSLALKSPQIIRNFKYLYGAIIGFIILGGYFIASGDPLGDTFRFTIGPWLGRIALILLAIVALPGILGRFRIEIPITRVITLFRRQLGITTFLIAYGHYSFVRGIAYIAKIIPFKLPLPIFEAVALWAFMILFVMFLTSNSFSVKKMGKWWKRLHRFVYVAMWLLVLHTILQRISIWSVLIFIFALLEAASWIYDKFSTRKQS